MMAPDKTPPNPFAGKAALHQRRGVRQLVKFALVGATSTAINFAVLNLMLIVLHQGKYASVVAAFLVSVVNGYIWNKRWTFREAQAKAVHTQFVQFLLVNLVGLGLNLLIIRLISGPLETDFRLSMVIATNVAELFATAVVVMWNFTANRLWTFKH